MTDLREHFYQTKNIEFLKNTLGKELWIQVSGNRNMDASSAVFWAALMPVENIDEAYRDYSWNSHIGTQCPGFIEYGGKITYEANPLNFDSCLNIVQYREFYGIKPNYIEISEEFRLLNNLYHDTNTNIFYEIEENGECTEVAKITDDDCVYIKLKSLMRYAAAKQMALLLFFDIRVKVSGSLLENGLEAFSDTVKEDGLFFGLSFPPMGVVCDETHWGVFFIWCQGERKPALSDSLYSDETRRVNPLRFSPPLKSL